MRRGRETGSATKWARIAGKGRASWGLPFYPTGKGWGDLRRRRRPRSARPRTRLAFISPRDFWYSFRMSTREKQRSISPLRNRTFADMDQPTYPSEAEGLPPSGPHLRLHSEPELPPSFTP